MSDIVDSRPTPGHTTLRSSGDLFVCQTSIRHTDPASSLFLVPLTRTRYLSFTIHRYYLDNSASSWKRFCSVSSTGSIYDLSWGIFGNVLELHKLLPFPFRWRLSAAHLEPKIILLLTQSQQFNCTHFILQLHKTIENYILCKTAHSKQAALGRMVCAL